MDAVTFNRFQAHLFGCARDRINEHAIEVKFVFGFIIS